MKKGKWNYTEDINYKVILVRLQAVEEKPMYWQNAFAGELRQVVEVTTEKGDYTFHIDNADGSGLLKILKGGGPDSYSAHVSGFTFIKELPENEWQLPDQLLWETNQQRVEDWQRTNYPEEFKRMEALKKTISQYNRKK